MSRMSESTALNSGAFTSLSLLSVSLSCGHLRVAQLQILSLVDEQLQRTLILDVANAQRRTFRRFLLVEQRRLAICLCPPAALSERDRKGRAEER